MPAQPAHPGNKAVRTEPPLRRLSIGVFIAILLVGLSAGPARAQGALATVTVVHGLPPSAYDIYVNGDLTLDGFEALTATEPLQLPAGEYDLAVRNVGAAANAQPVLQGVAVLVAAHNYSIVAHFTGEGRPTLSIFDNDTSAVPAGRSRLVVHDLAQAPSIDVRLDGESVFRGLTNSKQAATLLSAARYDVDVVPSGRADPLIEAIPLTLQEGSARLLYVIGSVGSRTLDLMSQQIPNLDSAPGGVSTGTGGLAADEGVPAWIIALMTMFAICAWGSGSALRRKRGRPAPARQAG